MAEKETQFKATLEQKSKPEVRLQVELGGDVETPVFANDNTLQQEKEHSEALDTKRINELMTQLHGGEKRVGKLREQRSSLQETHLHPFEVHWLHEHLHVDPAQKLNAEELRALAARAREEKKKNKYLKRLIAEFLPSAYTGIEERVARLLEEVALIQENFEHRN